MKYIFFFFLLTLSLLANADYRIPPQTMANISLFSVMQKRPNSTVWFYPSLLEYKRSLDNIETISGQTIFPKPGRVTSYDATVTHDVSPFYNLKKPQYAFTFNFATGKPGQFFSLGYSSATLTEKISIRPSFFLGFTDSYVFNKHHFLTLSLGSWFGGAISEIPCYDEYDRAYSCSTLKVWSDYHPKYPERYQYIYLKYLYFW